MASIICQDDVLSEADARGTAVKRINSAGLGIATLLGVDGLEPEVAVGLGHALRDLDAAVAALGTAAFAEEIEAPNNVVACTRCGEQVGVREHQHPVRIAERTGDLHGARTFVIIGGSSLLHQCTIGSTPTFASGGATSAGRRVAFDD